MKSPQLIKEDLHIDKLIPGGQALATAPDGKKIFLWNALPNETISEFLLVKNKSHYAAGIATKIAQSSPERTAPRDDCYLATSPWQIFSYDYEQKQKATLLIENFRQHDINIAQGVSFVSGAPYFYRNKMEYALYYSHEDEQIHLGFHERGSHRKVPVDSSSLERTEIWQQAQTIVAELNAQHAEARRYQSLLLRCNQEGAVSGGLLENGQAHPHFPHLKDELFGVSYSYSPNGFFQVNLPIYKMALEQIAQATTCSQVLDLYSGVGTIGYSVAVLRQNFVRGLTLVESNRIAYQELVMNQTSCSDFLSHNSLIHVKPVLAKSEEALEYIQPDQTVIVDPPRAGCMPTVIQKFREILPAQIIYLSCNPATQARDVKLLLDKYRLTKIQPYNFFPRTPHIENLIVLERK